MKDFIHTGLHTPTMTTTNDPLLKVTEIDNGNTWLMSFHVGDNLIDVINMEHPKGSEIHHSVKNLTVYDEDSNIIGTVESRLRNALSEADYWDGDESDNFLQ